MGHRNWKEPRKKKEKRFKEERPKQVRATQNDAWKNLKEWFWSIRYKTWSDAGYSDEEINDMFIKKEPTNYYDRYDKHPKSSK